jgi:hypothetical protein
MIREEVRVRLEKAFSKVAYLNSRAMDPEDFEQEMWLELAQWLAKHGEAGELPSGKHQGKQLMEQTPVFIAYRMAGRAAKNLWHLNRRRRRETLLEDMRFNDSPAATPAGKGSVGSEEYFRADLHMAHERGDSWSDLRTLVLWSYRNHDLSDKEQRAIAAVGRDPHLPEFTALVDTPPNYHISLGDSHEMALCKRFAALTGAEALDVLILLESKDGRYAQAMRSVLECGGARYTELQEMGVSCKLFTRSKRELAEIYD